MSTADRRELDGKVALLSGCGTILCGSIARRLASAGAHVVMNQARPSDELDSAARETSAVLAMGDASDPTVAARVVSEAEERIGPIDVLVFGASYLIKSPFIQHDPSDWWRHIEINLSAGFYLLHNVLPSMRERHSGRIIFLTSAAGIVGWPNASAATAASSGLITLTKTLGRELAPEGVLVNAVSTGPLDAPPYNLNGSENHASGPPIGRSGRSDEVAAVVDFLASVRASGFVGQVLQPNGGAIRTLA